jgi:hypothetical protein
MDGVVDRVELDPPQPAARTVPIKDTAHIVDLEESRTDHSGRTFILTPGPSSRSKDGTGTDHKSQDPVRTAGTTRVDLLSNRADVD